MKYQLEPINVNAIERKSRLPSDVKRAIELETIIEITNERAKELTKLEESLHNIGSECSEIGDKFYRLWDELVKRVTIKTIVLGQRKDAPEWRKDEEITIYSGGIGCRYYRRNHRLSFDDFKLKQEIRQWKKFRTRLYNLYQKYEKRASIFIAHKYL